MCPLDHIVPRLTNRLSPKNYGDLEKRARRIATHLPHKGICSGHFVAIVLSTCLEASNLSLPSLGRALLGFPWIPVHLPRSLLEFWNTAPPASSSLMAATWPPSVPLLLKEAPSSSPSHLLPMTASTPGNRVGPYHTKIESAMSSWA